MKKAFRLAKRELTRRAAVLREGATPEASGAASAAESEISGTMSGVSAMDPGAAGAGTEAGVSSEEPGRAGAAPRASSAAALKAAGA